MSDTNTNDTLEIKDENASATPEEVIEVVLAEEDTKPEKKEEGGMEYTEAELSGLTEAQRKRKYIFDKITTGILIALLASPFAILTYILLWFILK